MTKPGPKSAHHSLEARKKISEARKKYIAEHGAPKHTLEERKKLSLARRAYLARNGGTWGNHTQESKDHHSAVLKKRYQEDPEYRKKVGAAARKMWEDPKHREKHIRSLTKSRRKKTDGNERRKLALLSHHEEGTQKSIEDRKPRELTIADASTDLIRGEYIEDDDAIKRFKDAMKSLE